MVSSLAFTAASRHDAVASAKMRAMSTNPGRVASEANIFLVGLMGAGKTSVGKLLARKLGKTFYDSDHEVERVTGRRMADPKRRDMTALLERALALC